ncbi:MAG: hypothetical protein HY670_08010 [Chloroflexi bacterium]|nr:hypothetical protein [Chloroflexota bacterium]
MAVVVGALALAGAAWWWASLPFPSRDSAQVRVVHAAVNTTGCASCHVTPITAPFCTGCHPSPPTRITPAGIDFKKHHRRSPEKWYQDCQNSGCHAGVVGDVRYAVRPALISQTTGHDYCFNTCHKTQRVDPSCKDCHDD